MDITYINCKNIKISVSREELVEGGIDVNEFDYSQTKTRRFIWELLDKAYVQTGFDAADSKLYVRVFPAPDGGCELFITKRGELSDEKDSVSLQGFICVIRGSESLYMLCQRLKIAGFNGNSRLFSSDDDTFALLCTYSRKLPSYVSVKTLSSRRDYGFATDYGTLLELTDEREAYLMEHMNLVCGDEAVEHVLA